MPAGSATWLPFFLGLVSGAATASLGAWLATRRFYLEKHWDRKAQAYEEIVRALHDAVQFFQVHKENYGQGTGMNSDQEMKLRQKYLSAISILNKAMDIGALYISDKGAQILSDLGRREVSNEWEEPPFEIWAQEFDLHKAALEKMIALSRKELRSK